MDLPAEVERLSPYSCTSLDDGELLCAIGCIGILPLVPDALQFLDVELLYLLQFGARRIRCLLDRHGAPYNGNYRMAVGHKAERYPDTPAVEEGQREAKDLLEPFLELVQVARLIVDQL